jgi:hypothetical protein
MTGPSRILAAALSGPRRDVGIFEVEGGSVTTLASLASRAAPNEPIDLSRMMIDLLRRARMRGDQIDLYAAALGPGDTTEGVLEPALEALQGLALSFERPLLLLSSLEALACSVLDVVAHSVRGSTAETRSVFSAHLRAVKEHRRRRIRVMPVLPCRGRTAVGVYAFERGRLARVEERIVDRLRAPAQEDVLVVGSKLTGTTHTAVHPDAPRAVDVARAAAARPLQPFRASEIASMSVEVRS